MLQSLKINDLFWTIQGEGRNAGRRSLFLRLPFCNLQCPWCDTSFNTFKEYALEDFLKFTRQESSRLCVVTGGEPTKNKQLPEIVNLLKDEGFEVACESNGTYSPYERIDWLTVSPKSFQEIPYFVHEDAFKKASEFKYVVDAAFDFSILDRHDLNDGRLYYLSPEFGDMKGSIEKIINYMIERPLWKLSLQTHKWIGVP